MRKKRFVNIFIIFTLLVSMWLLSCKDALAKDFDYSIFDKLLGKYISRGKVDYIKWKKNDFIEFKQYIQSLESASLERLNPNQEKAFWINAYNALTIYAVLNHMPSNSIVLRGFSVQMVSGFFDKITYSVASEELTLNAIENEKLRDEFSDARIHFAIVCASGSCPKIQSVVFKGKGLNSQLDNVARRFIQDKKKNRLNKKTNTLYLSYVFDWYSDDFIREDASVINYLKKYSREEDAQYLSQEKPEIKYLYYNWFLNYGKLKKGVEG